MSETLEGRYYQSTRDRHMQQVRKLAESIQADAGYVLARLDRDAIPQTYSLTEDVRNLVQRIAVLEALAEMKKVYDSAQPETTSGPVLHETTTSTYCPKCGEDHGSQDYVDQLNEQEADLRRRLDAAVAAARTAASDKDEWAKRPEPPVRQQPDRADTPSVAPATFSPVPGDNPAAGRTD